MPTETVLVQGKADPERGKTRGRIKSDTGKLFQAVPDILKQIEVGLTYEITYKDQTFNEAKYRVVEAVNPQGVPPNKSMSNTETQAAIRGKVSAPVEDRRGDDIATLAIYKPWGERIPVGDEGAVVHALRVARRSWLKFKSQSDPKIESGPSVRDEMADEIPDWGGPND